MEDKKPRAEETKDVRYDASGKMITTSARSREIENAILAINDKLDQLLGILSSTLPTRLGSELKNITAGGEHIEKLIEVVSRDLPERIKEDASQNTFEKAEMISMVMSTSFQHLQDALKSYQESTLKAMENLTGTNQKISDVLVKINELLGRMHAGIGGDVKTQPVDTADKKEEPAPASPPQPASAFPPAVDKPREEPKTEPQPPSESKPVEKSDLPGWLQAKREENKDEGETTDPFRPKPPDAPSGSY